jgi:hypothetical protein
VAIGDVVNGLTDGPAAGAIGRVELSLVKAGDGFSNALRYGGDVGDECGALSIRVRAAVFEFSDRIGEIEGGCGAHE